MNDTQKKIAAAIGAVSQYLRMEEEMAASQFTAADAAPAASAGPKLWALNGRQTLMQLRNLMQLRAFGRIA
jgi:urease accessory protein UreF